MLMAFSWSILAPIIQPMIGILTLGIGTVIAHALKTPKDHERAAEIGAIAADAAKMVVSETGGAPWAVVLQQVIDQLRQSAPTSNETVLRRAAVAALKDAGVTKPTS